MKTETTVIDRVRNFVRDSRLGLNNYDSLKQLLDDIEGVCRLADVVTHDATQGPQQTAAIRGGPHDGGLIFSQTLPATIFLCSDRMSSQWRTFTSYAGVPGFDSRYIYNPIYCSYEFISNHDNVKPASVVRPAAISLEDKVVKLENKNISLSKYIENTRGELESCRADLESIWRRLFKVESAVPAASDPVLLDVPRRYELRGGPYDGHYFLGRLQPPLAMVRVTGHDDVKYRVVVLPYDMKDLATGSVYHLSYTKESVYDYCGSWHAYWSIPGSIPREGGS